MSAGMRFAMGHGGDRRRGKSSARALVAVAVVVGMLVPLSPRDRAGAQGGVPGTLDPTFDVDGIAVNELVSQLSEVADAERLPDGRILVLADGHLWRFFADGSLDTSFDLDGVLELPVSGPSQAAELALRPGGGFVVSSGGGTNDPTCPAGRVSKFADDGSLVPAFDSDGTACIVFPNFSGALISDLVVQADDQVVVLGNNQVPTQANHVALARLDTTGATVDTIVQAGSGTTSFESGEELAIQADGNIVVLGSTGTFPDFSTVDVVLSRYLEGPLTLDPTFGTGGLSFENSFLLDSSRSPLQLALRPDGPFGPQISVAFGGEVTSTPTDIAAIEQLWFDGDSGDLEDSPVLVELPGRTFVTVDDLTTTPLGYMLTGHVAATATEPTDAIVAIALGMESTVPDPDDIAPLILSHPQANLGFGGGRALLSLAGDNVFYASVFEGPAGEQLLFNQFIEVEETATDPRTVTLDPTIGTAFGEPGFLTRNAFTFDRAEAVAVQPDAKVIVGGHTSTASAGPPVFVGDDGFVMRHNDDGTLDATFGGPERPGVTFVDFDVNGVALAPGGGVVAAGSRFFPSNGSSHQDGAVQRLLASGLPDPTWNDGEPVFVNPEGFLPGWFFRDVAVQTDGKVVVVGDFQDNCQVNPPECDHWIAIVRFEEDGDLDPTFGTGGVAQFGPTPATDGAEGHGIALQPDGKVVVTGSLAGQLVVARVSAAGTPDPTFGIGGLVTHVVGTGGLGRDVAVRPDGRIVVAGDRLQFTCPTPLACFTFRTAIATQYLAGGTPDAGFGTAGIVPITTGASQSEGHGVAVDGVGNVVVGGTALAGATAPDVLLARLTTTGAFDPQFGTNGVVLTNVDQSETGHGLAIAPDGKIVVAGANNDTRGDRVLTARYEAGSALQCGPSPLDLGSVVLGTGSSNGTVTCTNTGPSRLTITGIVTSGTNAADFAATTAACLVTLSPGESCQVPVAFTPGGVGARVAALSVAHTGQGAAAPIAVALQGTGIGRDTSLTFEPPSLTFAEQLGLTTSPAQTVTVTNIGTVPVTINGVSFENDPAGDFAVAPSSTCTGATLPPGGSCQVSVTFTPRAPGARTATLRFDDNGVGAPHRVPLNGTGATPVVLVDPGVGRAGFVTSARGVNFPPLQPVLLQWGEPGSVVPGGFAEPPASVTTGADGTFSAALLVFPKSTVGTRALLAAFGAFGAEGVFLVAPTTMQGPEFVIRG